MLVDQIETNRPRVEIAYRRGVQSGGNQKALEIMNRVFEVSDADWRGLGVLHGSGLKLRKEFQQFDASLRFPTTAKPVRKTRGCICGDILRGTKTPVDCTLFGKACLPETPVGPCMVSSEGSCSAYYLYGRANG
jgi:hydrogenase expression/formation protein HypD